MHIINMYINMCINMYIYMRITCGNDEVAAICILK